MVVDIPDVVTYKNFGDHRLRVFLGVGVQISPSPIDFQRRPYNTFALPCERAMEYLHFSLSIILTVNKISFNSCSANCMAYIA